MIDSSKLKVKNERQDLGFEREKRAKLPSVLLKFMKNAMLYPSRLHRILLFILIQHRKLFGARDVEKNWSGRKTHHRRIY